MKATKGTRQITITGGNTEPENNLKGYKGDLYVYSPKDGTPALYQKQSGGFSKTGWVSISGAASNVSQWIRITKTYDDFAAADTENDISIYTLPANGVIQGFKIINPTTTFSGGSINAYTISIGIVGDLKIITGNQDVDIFTGATFTQVNSDTYMFSATTSTDIRANAISTGANLNAATQGVVLIYLLVSTLPD